MAWLFRRWRWLYLAVLAGMFAPLGALVIGWTLGSLFGCADTAWNEGEVPDCPGGEWISLFTLSSWYALVTLPAGAVLLVLVALAHAVARSRARRETPDRTLGG